MAQLSNEEVKKIANLARLGISEEEAQFYAEELSAVLKYIEQLNEVDTKNVEVRSHTKDLHSISREDRVSERQVGAPGGDLAAILMKSVPFQERGFARVKFVFSKKERE